MPDRERRPFFGRVLAILGKVVAAGVVAVLVLELSLRLAGSLVAEKRGEIRVDEQHHVILCIGDSHTWGGGKGYPARLAERLAQRSDRYRVINLGVPGTNTAQLRRRLSGYLDRYHPRAVVMWDGINNSWNQTDTDVWQGDGAQQQAPAGQGWLDRTLERSRLVRFVRAWRREAELNRVLASADPYIAPVAAPGPNIWTDHRRNLFGVEDDFHNQGGGKVPPPELERVTAADVRWMIDETTRRGIPFVAITYAIGETSVLAVNRGVEAAVAGTQAMLVPSFEAVRTLKARHEASQGPTKVDVFFDKTAHPTQEQYDLIGDMVLEQLDARQLLPGDRAKVSVLPLGDSITEKWGKVSYRYWLWQGLRADGWGNVDFVGTQKDPWGGDFDAEHEGHGGWSARQLWQGRPDRPKEGSLEGWLAGQAPDVVLLQAGTNDFIQHSCPLQKRTCSDAQQVEEFRQAVAEAREAIVGMIEILRKHKADVVIVLAQIPPIVWVPDEDVRRLNDEIAAIENELTTPLSPIILVDLHEGFVVAPTAPDSDTVDGVHPNFEGAKKIGARFQRALTSEVLPRLTQRTVAH